MVDGNGEPLYPTNHNMPSSSNHLGLMVLHRELDLFYDNLVARGYSNCKWLKVNPQRVTLTYYINDQLPKVDGLITPIAIKNPICVIERTRRNTPICSLFENLEAKSTMFHPKL